MINPVKSEYVINTDLTSWSWLDLCLLQVRVLCQRSGSLRVLSSILDFVRTGLVQTETSDVVTAARVSAITTVLFPHLLWYLVQISQNQSRQSGSLIVIMNRKCIFYYILLFLVAEHYFCIKPYSCCGNKMFNASDTAGSCFTSTSLSCNERIRWIPSVP